MTPTDGDPPTEATSGPPGRVSTPIGKRVLVEIAHAIEQFALSSKPGTPVVVAAMFQRHTYFAHEHATYARIAQRSDATVVGVVDEAAGAPPPPGVQLALLRDDDALAREWNVTVLSPLGGATLVAHDEEVVDVGARTLEEGRRFHGRWSFRRSDACREMLRLRSMLPLPPATVDAIDAVLRSVLDSDEPPQQDWWDVPLRFLADRLDTAAHDAAHAQERADMLAGVPDPATHTERDPRTGLHTAAFLERWTRGLGEGLPVGLGLLHLPGLNRLRTRHGLRAEIAALQGIAHSADGLLGPVDRLVRTSDDEFLLVLPSWRESRVLAACDEMCVRLAQLDRRFPFIPLEGVAAATVTRQRPLPLARMRSLAKRGAVGSVALLDA